MKANQFSDLSMSELQEKVKELKAELFTLRFQLATGQLQNTMTIQGVKRDIARAKTIQRQLEIKARA
jgi:large subunit ribosomal protein L29